MEEGPKFGLIRLRPVLTFLALFSGIALLLNILLTLDLRLGLGILTLFVITAFALMIRRADATERRAIRRSVLYGAVAGLLATVAYDVARTVLTSVDPSPYLPFEAITRFGQLLLATDARTDLVVLVGALYHALNGASFGVAYTLLLARDGAISRRRAVLLGMVWGLFLELFQVALYPDWLNVKYYAEFVTISALAHVVYGATLGTLSVYLLRRASAIERGS